MTIVEFLAGLLIARIFYSLLMDHISDKINERRKEETIQSHLVKKDYLWILENCGNSDSNIKVYSYGFIPYECRLNAKQMLMELKNISFEKRFEIAYHQKIIRYFNHTIVGDREIFYMPANSKEDLAIKYLVFFILEKEKTSNPEEYIRKIWDNYRLTVMQIRESFKDEEEFRYFLKDACTKVSTIMKKDDDFYNQKFTIKEIFGPGKVQMTNRYKLKGINKPKEYHSRIINPTIQYAINNHKIEYFANTNQYFVDDIEVASVSSIVEYVADIKGYEEVACRESVESQDLRIIRPNIYERIKNFEEAKQRSNTYEFQSYLKIKKQENFKHLESEKIVLFCNENDIPLYCGQVDFVINKKNQIGLLDIQRNDEINVEKIKLKLNLLRLAYMQSYNSDIEFLDVIRFKMKENEYQIIDIDEYSVQKIIEDVLI